MFGKRLSQITVDDLHRLVSEETPESAELEFKAQLPAKEGRDRWWIDQQQIGDKAKIEIVEEVIAFANAHGGLLLIGIDETEDHPHRACAITAVPKCHDLASRLKLVCRDLIEPQIASIEVEGIATHQDG